jgi:hypothetical protein
MTVTPEQKLALGATLIVGDCLRVGRERGASEADGLEAAEIVLAIESDDWVRARADEHEGMRATLGTLDKALEKGRVVRLAMEDELKKQARLYGAGTVCPIPVATTEVGLKSHGSAPMTKP